jgi:hypothetical protein
VNLLPAQPTSLSTQTTQPRTVQIGGEIAEDNNSPPIAVTPPQNAPDTPAEEFPPLPDVDSDEFHTPSERSRAPSPSTASDTLAPSPVPVKRDKCSYTPQIAFALYATGLI